MVKKEMIDVRPKIKLFKVLGLTRSSGERELCTSSRVYTDQEPQSSSYNVQAHMLSNQRAHEIESQKAMTISLSRHEKWKAGGPL
ncbi:MAG: hypothetical protein OEZ21_03540 [Candidatus Bathyarchaeota archaeon]|nr:hypothetical protein [Candidatus Bathyarchaeota archaeon]MDH5746014.1 hypothetical protein [Candidatus Bathyarchaeota archaeon]